MDKTTYEAAYKQLEDADMGDAPALKDKMADADEPAAVLIVASPAENPVKAAHKAEKDAESAEFSKAFNSDKPETLRSDAIAPQAEAAGSKEPATFKDAFADARTKMKAGGPNIFEFKGKKYSTALKGEGKADIKPDDMANHKAAKKGVSPAVIESKMAAKADKSNEKSIYAGSIADTLPAMIKAKLDDKVEYNGQRHASGKPNLAPAR
jgi:hypothetical protein